ncbi:hypothetical protein Tco_0999798 [Tanacetum coccineum]
MVVHSSAKVVPEVEDPSTKKLKVMMDIPNLVSLNFMGPITFNNVSFEQFAAQLSSSGQPKNLSTVHPTMTRSPSSKIDKGKGITTPSDESALKTSMPLMQQGGSTPNLSIRKRFRTTNDPPLTIQEEENIFAYLKEANEKSKKTLKRMKPTQ